MITAAPIDLSYSPESRRLPWNVMGGDLTTSHASVEDAMEATGLNYDVEVRDLFSAKNVDGVHEDFIHAPSLRTLVRPMPDGTERVLAASGTRYTPIQNRDAFQVGNLLVAEYGAKIAGAADYRNGGASLLVLDLAQPIHLDRPDGGTDLLDLNLMIKNAHDGSAALTFALTAMRPACTNAVQAALGQAKRVWKVNHTPQAQGRVDLAKQSIIAAMNYSLALQEKAQQMLDTQMVDAEFDKIVATLWKVKDGTEDTRTGKRLLDVQDAVKGLYRGSKTLAGIRGTRWGGYNAITEYLDWGRPVKGGDVSRAEGALDGFNVRAKERVWALLAA
jgi:phage/plasmid-like protein (TIGR03299 family)